MSVRRLIAFALLALWVAGSSAGGQDADATPGSRGQAGAPNELRTTVIFSAQRLGNGHTVVVLGYALDDAEVVELDAAGRVRWRWSGPAGAESQRLAWTHSAQYLAASDTFLLADTGNDRVIEVNRAGEIVWSFAKDGLDYPNDADRLANGHTLITVRDGHQLVEVNPAGEVVWTSTTVHGPHNADRLANGHTMVADSGGNRALELDAEGAIVWQFTRGLRWPRDADRLANGHTLIVDTGNGRVLEVDARGQLAWEYRDAPMAYDADRLADGHTLITTNGQRAQVIEVDRAGRIVWQWHAPVSRHDRAGITFQRDSRPATLREEIRGLHHQLQDPAPDDLEAVQRLIKNDQLPAAVDRLRQMLGGSPQKVTARLQDADGQPVAGASVLAIGMRAAAVTDEDGSFALEFTAMPDDSVWICTRANGFRDSISAVVPAVLLRATDDNAWRSEFVTVVFGILVADPESAPDATIHCRGATPASVFARTSVTALPQPDNATTIASLANLQSRGFAFRASLPVVRPQRWLIESRITVALASLESADTRLDLTAATPKNAPHAVWCSHPQWMSEPEPAVDAEDVTVTIRPR